MTIRPERPASLRGEPEKLAPNGFGYRSLADPETAVQGSPASICTAILTIVLAVGLARPAWADSGILPDTALTPGSVRSVDVVEICGSGTSQLRHWSRERDDRILAEYGLEPGPHPEYEIDHLVPLGIGGADDDTNLWPEPRRSIEPQWNAEAKDRLEMRLRTMICNGQLNVREAQRMISEDWTETYKKIVSPAIDAMGPGR